MLSRFVVLFILDLDSISEITKMCSIENFINERIFPLKIAQKWFDAFLERQEMLKSIYFYKKNLFWVDLGVLDFLLPCSAWLVKEKLLF